MLPGTFLTFILQMEVLGVWLCVPRFGNLNLLTCKWLSCVGIYMGILMGREETLTLRNRKVKFCRELEAGCWQAGACACWRWRSWGLGGWAPPAGRCWFCCWVVSFGACAVTMHFVSYRSACVLPPWMLSWSLPSSPTLQGNNSLIR